MVMHEQDIMLCNCAECGCALLGNGMILAFSTGLLPYPYNTYSFVAARVRGRPYCGRCLSVAHQPPSMVRSSLDREDIDEGTVDPLMVGIRASNGSV